MSYYYTPYDARQMIAVRKRYADDHPEFDPRLHEVRSVQRLDDWRAQGSWEIVGHEPKDPQIEAMFAMCCCHPDKPRGHED